MLLHGVGQIVVVVRAVDGQVARVDHEVGRRRRQPPHHPVPVPYEEAVAAAQVRVRHLHHARWCPHTRTVSGVGATTDGTRRDRVGPMIERAAFGRTGHLSSRVIFGAAALSRLSQEEADPMLEVLDEFGVNHLDTAAIYGDSELAPGPLVARHRDRSSSPPRPATAR